MIHLSLDYRTDKTCSTPGGYLRYHRTLQGLSTRELADKVGIVPAAIALYENGAHPIKYGAAVALADKLGINRKNFLMNVLLLWIIHAKTFCEKCGKIFL